MRGIYCLAHLPSAFWPGKSMSRLPRMRIKQKKQEKIWLFKKIVLPLHSLNNKVPWMSGLVNGLQNRLRRFESARHLIKATNNVGCFFVILSRQLSSTFLSSTFFPSGYPPLYGILKFCSILSLLSSPHNPRRKPIDHPRHNSWEHPHQAESEKEQ